MSGILNPNLSGLGGAAASAINPALSGLSAGSSTASKLRQPVGNGNLAPYTNTTTTSRVLTFVKKRYVAKDASRSLLRFRYVNFTAGGVSEAVGYPDMVIKAGYAASYGGAVTAATFNKGASEVYLPAGAAFVETDDINVTVAAGAAFYEIVRIVLPLLFKTRTVPFVVGMVVTGGTSGATGTVVKVVDGTTGSLTLQSETGTFVDGEVLTGVLAGYTNGVAVADRATTQTLIYTISSHKIWNEGVIGNGNTSINYTTAFPNSLPVLTPAIVSGNISTVAGTGGTGNVSALNLVAYQWTNNVLYSKTIGYCNVGGGAITSSVVTSGTPPAGLAAWDATCKVMASSGSGFGTDSAIYCAAEVNGIPSVPVKTITVIGDSISRGDSATDSTGDLFVNHGIERAVANAVAVNNMSRSSASLSYDYQGLAGGVSTIYPRLYGLYMGRTTHALITQSRNDVAALATQSAIAGYINTLSTYVRSFGTKVALGTCVPSTTGTWTTEAGQTAIAGFTSGGVRDQLNTALRNGTILSDFGLFDIDAFFYGVDATKWRVDLNGGGTASTQEGIHPSLLGWGYEGADPTLSGFFTSLP